MGANIDILFLLNLNQIYICNSDTSDTDVAVVAIVMGRS